MNVWPFSVLPSAAFNVIDAVAVSAVVGVSTAMAVPDRPNMANDATAAQDAASFFESNMNALLVSVLDPRPTWTRSESPYARFQ